MKPTLSISLISILLITMALFLVNAVYFAEVRQEGERRARASQETALKTFWQLLHSQGEGFELDDRGLVLGNRPLDSRIPDIIQNTFGCTASIYRKKMRIATSLSNRTGESSTGTEMRGMIANEIFVHRLPYRGKDLIDGQLYFDAFDPIFDAEGNVIGALSVQLSSSEFFSGYDDLRNDVIYGSLFIEFILVLVSFLFFREYRAQEKLLSENENSYRLLFSKMLNGCALYEVVYDNVGEPIDYRFLQTNAAFDLHTGLRQEELLGRTLREVLPDFADCCKQRYGNVAKTEMADHFEIYSAELGRWLEISAYCPRTGQFVGMFADITQRKKTEEKLQEVANILSACSGETVFQSLTANLTKLLPVDYALIGECDSETPDRVRTLSVYNQGEKLQNFEYQLTGTPSANVLDDNLCIYPEKVRHLFPDAQVLTELQAEGFAGVPLKLADGTILGVLALFSLAPLKLSSADESILRLFAQRAAIELHRRKAQQALFDSEHRYRTLFDTTGTATILIEENTVISLANREFGHLSQYSRRELETGMSFLDFFDPASRDKMLAFHRQRRIDPASAPSTYECILLCKDGSCRHLLAHVSLIPGTARSIVSLHDITPLKALENSLQEQVAFLQTLIDTIPNPVFFKDRAGRYLGYNQAFELFVGLSRKELIGKTVFDVSPPLLAKKYFAMDEELFSRPGVQTYDAPVFYADGSLHEVVFYKATFNDRAGAVGGLVGIMLDVTELKRSEAALRESEERFHQLFTQHPDAVLLLKSCGDAILDANPAAAAMFGYGHDEFLCCTLTDLLDPTEIPSLRPADFRFEKIAARRRDGSQFVISLWGKTVQLHDKQVIFCSIRDITEKIQLEEAIKATQAKLIHTNKMTSLGILSSSMGHEINNPNSYIAVNAAMLADVWADSLSVLQRYFAENGDFSLGGLPFSEMESKVPRLCNSIKEGSQRIDAIVKGLKNFVRDEQGRRHAALSINSIVEQAAGILWHHIHKHTDHFDLSLDEDLPAVFGNAQQLEQVVINLIMNALQALPDKQARVSVATRREDKTIMVAVRDGGKGMDATVLKKLTEPFFTTRMEEGGSGLGLYISASIIGEHQGTMEFNSAPGGGTTAVIRLPLAAGISCPNPSVA